jgi:sporulation and spore germination protein
VGRAFVVVLVAVAALAAVASVRAATQSAIKTRSVSIYAPHGANSICARVLPLVRLVDARAPLKGAVRALLEGPTKTERAHGYGGWFSTRTGGHLRSVRIASGVAYIDFKSFAHDIPNASSSCGSALLLAQLDRTALQFSSVKRAVYSFDGSTAAFYEWLERSAPPMAFDT